MKKINIALLTFCLSFLLSTELLAGAWRFDFEKNHNIDTILVEKDTITLFMKQDGSGDQASLATELYELREKLLFSTITRNFLLHDFLDHKGLGGVHFHLSFASKTREALASLMIAIGIEHSERQAALKSHDSDNPDKSKKRLRDFLSMNSAQ